jgi:hypothetical protein
VRVAMSVQGLCQQPGSSSPTLTTAATPLQVTWMATFGRRRSQRLHRYLNPLRLRCQRHYLVLNHTCLSTPTTAGGISVSFSPLYVSQLFWSLLC